MRAARHLYTHTPLLVFITRMYATMVSVGAKTETGFQKLVSCPISVSVTVPSLTILRRVLVAQ